MELLSRDIKIYNNNTMQTLEYQGFKGSVEVSLERNLLHGKIILENSADLISYQAETVAQLKIKFKLAVEEYLEVKALFASQILPPALTYRRYVKSVKKDMLNTEYFTQYFSPDEQDLSDFIKQNIEEVTYINPKLEDIQKTIVSDEIVYYYLTTLCNIKLKTGLSVTGKSLYVLNNKNALRETFTKQEAHRQECRAFLDGLNLLRDKLK